MKILPVLLNSCCIALLCISLSACSSHPKRSALHRSPTPVTDADIQDEEIASAEPEETAQEELEALNKPGAWEYGVKTTYSLEKLGIDPSKYDFPITVNKQVLYYLELFQGKQRNYFTQWLARSTIYRPYIERELKRAGLPLDLVYLAMIESGFNPSAYSPAEACGLWQFMEGTAQTYKLRVDSWVDERREPEKATKAAIRYLSRLYSQFGDWYLAVAAYNAGEGKIDTAMKTYNASDFWEVAASEGIFMETKRYVPKLIAAIIIARNPEKYGFTDIAYKTPHEYETITVPGGVALEAVALTANTSIKQLRSLNNELRKNQTPPKNEYTLRIPVGCKELIAANLDKLRPVTRTVYTTHTVKKGETLTEICNLYKISKTSLLKANNLRTAQLKRGLRLQIPSTSTKYVLLNSEDQAEDRVAKVDKPGKMVKVEPAKQQAVSHRVKQGETVASIAKQYQVSTKDILRWNKIANSSTIKSGQKLSLYPERPQPEPVTVAAKAVKIAAAKTAAIPTLDPSTKKQSVQNVAKAPSGNKPEVIKPTATKTSIAKTAKAEPAAKVSVAIAKSTKPHTWYVVKNGDTLTAIAKKFQTSTQDIRAWNKLSTNTVQTGNKLLVKKG
ncbi:Lytic transglycosylase catalytic [Desulfobulbus propionicus DSM 2032]|jgi:membrane-bound lytic murein transglycosylase D|uniref:Lytic transglycosylase catalytic n=1 Tax=Desulfobulbus propionicus (strain ATCC 33891 / DSM 2032 / VKM B-1956 / 1pr3) TaxID=577650 RepID=A0A7U4DNF3_DESPD|nr:Lytic transglycosylase catalytic [Desulfobulbus propionicus DSM 2032]